MTVACVCTGCVWVTATICATTRYSVEYGLPFNTPHPRTVLPVESAVAGVQSATVAPISPGEVSDAILSSGRGYRYRRAAAADASRRSFEPRDDDDAGTASDTNCERVSFGRLQP